MGRARVCVRATRTHARAPKRGGRKSERARKEKQEKRFLTPPMAAHF